MCVPLLGGSVLFFLLKHSALGITAARLFFVGVVVCHNLRRFDLFRVGAVWLGHDLLLLKLWQQLFRSVTP